MDINLLTNAIAQLPKEPTNLSLITTIETGLDSLFGAVETIALKSNKDNSLINTIDDILDVVHAKIDGALTTFSHLGSIAADLATKGEAMLETLKYIWNLMISIIKSLQPVTTIVCKLYPQLEPVFILLSALPSIS